MMKTDRVKQEREKKEVKLIRERLELQVEEAKRIKEGKFHSKVEKSRHIRLKFKQAILQVIKKLGRYKMSFVEGKQQMYFKQPFYRDDSREFFAAVKQLDLINV